MRNLCYNLGVVPGAKGLSPHELAHKWVKGLLNPTSEIKKSSPGLITRGGIAGPRPA